VVDVVAGKGMSPSASAPFDLRRLTLPGLLTTVIGTGNSPSGCAPLPFSAVM